MAMDETTDASRGGSGVSRRGLIKGAGLAAGAAWVVPSVLTLSASPAMASPLGCLVCGQPFAINGAGNDLTGWSAVGGNPWTSTGTVFQGPSGLLQGVRERPVYNFSAECVARLLLSPPVQPRVQITLSGRLRGGPLNVITTDFYVDFFGLANAAGAIIGTTALFSTSATLPASPTSVTEDVPIGTRSMRIRADIARTNLGAAGQAAGLTVAFEPC